MLSCTEKRDGKWIELTMAASDGLLACAVVPITASKNEIGKAKDAMRRLLARRRKGIPSLMDRMRRKDGKGRPGHVERVDEGARLVWLSGRKRPLRWRAVEWCE